MLQHQGLRTTLIFTQGQHTQARRLKQTAQAMTQRGPGARGQLKWVEVPGCGHAPALNVPEHFALIDDFLARAG